nr:spindle assembly abnormal protein 6 homolog [Vanessa tameamea]
MVFKTFHKGKYFISFKRGFDESKKDITITVDKFFQTDTLRLTLSDDDDPAFLCKINLTRCDYEELKKQQGLLIDFDNFPSQVVRLLQQCATNNMFLIIQQITPIQYNFEVVEHNEFRRLIHLCLKTGPASDNEVKQHMAETIGELKKSLTNLKCLASSNEMMWNEKYSNMEAKVHDLTLTVSKMEEDKLRHEKEFQEAMKLEKDRIAQEKVQWQMNNDNHTKSLLNTAQETINKKEKQIDDLSYLNKQLQDNTRQLENQISDKAQRLTLVEKEVQKSHIEVATLKAKNAALERDIIEKEKQVNQLCSKSNYLEKVTKDNSDVIKELNENIQTLKMEKGSLERRLTISESLASKNNEAAQSTTEQLLKANQIISKQNNDIIEMKDKLLCRTAIALEQEKVIERNMKEIQDLRSELAVTKESVDKLRKELDSLKEKNNSNEQALLDRDETIKNNNMVIQWLHKKIEGIDATDYMQNKSRKGLQTGSSTPYSQTKNIHNNSSQGTDESINFYATSKLLSIDESPQPSAQNKKGLDPKYLEPSTEENQALRKDIPRPISTLNKKGKENKCIELPKVDYREKKSSRATTYRATPISAYFKNQFYTFIQVTIIKMWNDQSVAGGGFFNSPNQFGNVTTPNQGQNKTGRRASRTAPIVIKQALHSGDEGIKIWGTEIQIVSLVARVKNIRVQSTKITYTIQDITGRMRAVLWLEQDAMDEDADTSMPKIEVNDYIQVYGNVKTNKGKKVVMAFKIMPVADVNAITFHYLQCINNKLKMEADSKKTKPNEDSTFTSGLPANSMVGIDDNASVNGLNARQMMVYNLIRASTLEQGISKQDIYASLKDRMSNVEFGNILEWMWGEGHIYSTIDEEHFRATDACF